MMKEEKIKSWIIESIAVKNRSMNLIPEIIETADIITEAYKTGGKVVIFGNGGSAADSQHVAGEFINKFRLERKPLPAIALSTDTSVLTCIGNDSAFDEIFEKQIEALVTEKDVAIGISTSGNSKNVIRALEKAKLQRAKTIALTGENGGKVSDIANVCLKIPSNDTPRIQESHITILHIICDLVESELFG